jgi:hypothetical protein
MERRRAIAWAGSVALVGGVTALVVGSTLGGFGLGTSRAPQIEAISPGSKPQTTQEAPLAGTPGPPPVPGGSPPDPEPAPGGSVPLATTTAVAPVPDTVRDTTRDLGEPAANSTSPKIIVVSPLAATGPDVSAPPRVVGKPNTRAEKKKAPASITGKRSNHVGSIIGRQKWAAVLTWIRGIFEHICGSKVGRAGPPGGHDAPSTGRVRGAEPGAGAAHHYPRARYDGRDG